MGKYLKAAVIISIGFGSLYCMNNHVISPKEFNDAAFNVNYILFQAFELDIYEHGRMHWNLEEYKYREYSETFNSFPNSIQLKLRRFIKLQKKVATEIEDEFYLQQNSSSSTSENAAEKLS